MRNLDVVEAIHRQRSALVHELRRLGVTLRGGELPGRAPTLTAPDVRVDGPEILDGPDVRVDAMEAPEAPVLPPAPQDALLAEAIGQWEANRGTGLSVPEWPDAPGVDVALPPPEPIPLPQAIAVAPEGDVAPPVAVDVPVAPPVAPNPFTALDSLTAASMAVQAQTTNAVHTTTNTSNRSGDVHVAAGAITVTRRTGPVTGGSGGGRHRPHGRRVPGSNLGAVRGLRRAVRPMSATRIHGGALVSPGAVIDRSKGGPIVDDGALVAAGAVLAYACTVGVRAVVKAAAVVMPTCH